MTERDQTDAELMEKLLATAVEITQTLGLNPIGEADGHLEQIPDTQTARAEWAAAQLPEKLSGSAPLSHELAGVDRVIDRVLHERIAIHADREAGAITFAEYQAGLAAVRSAESTLEQTRRQLGARSRARELSATEHNVVARATLGDNNNVIKFPSA